MTPTISPRRYLTDVAWPEERSDRHLLPVGDVEHTADVAGFDCGADDQQHEPAHDRDENPAETHRRGAPRVREAASVGRVVAHSRAHRGLQEVDDDLQHDDDQPVDERRDDERGRVLAELVPRPGERLTDVVRLCATVTRRTRRITRRRISRCTLRRRRIAAVLGWRRITAGRGRGDSRPAVAAGKPLAAGKPPRRVTALSRRRVAALSGGCRITALSWGG